LWNNNTTLLYLIIQKLDVIKTRLRELDISNIHLVQGIVEDMPLEDSSKDIVIASMVLHAVESLSK
jgi:ubiquinone/menaquinone biosynthesis C-methylase UbiE